MSEETTIVETPAVAAPAVEAPSEPEASKTFTQVDLDNAINARMGREHAKFERQIREERETRIRMEERLAAAQPKPKEGGDAPPKLSDFEDFEKYVEAKAEWVADQHVTKRLNQSQKTQDQQAAQFRQQQAVQGYFLKVQAFRKEAPDFDEVVSNTPSPLTDSMKSFILESDQGPRLAYYLGQHSDEARQIAELTPSGAARKLTLIEAGFQANVTKTPPPISPTGARQTPGVRALTDITSSEEFMKRRRDFLAKKR